MATSTTKSSTESTKVEKSSNKTKHEVLLSVYRYKGKIVSVHGVTSESSDVQHVIPKKSIPGDGWYQISSIVNSGVYRKTETNDLLNQVLNDKNESVRFPAGKAQSQKSFGELQYSLETTIVEI